MASELIATIQVWQGAKSDVKPLEAPAGSRFTELDGIEWVKHETQWMPAPNYLAEIAQNTNDISGQMARQHQDIAQLIDAVKRITKR